MGTSRHSGWFAFARDPWWWSALVVLVLNDHVLKYAEVLPGAVTGKLSDFAGLYLAPAVLVALLGGRAPRAAFLATGAVFAAINVSRGAADLVEALLPWQIWTDPSDLVALPMLWVAWRRHMTPGRQDSTSKAPARPPGGLVWRERGALVLGAMASVATGIGPIDPGPRRIDTPGTGQLQVLGMYGAEVDDEIGTREVVRVRRLRSDVSVDCERLARDPRRVLSRALFAPAERWSLGHTDALAFTSNGECDAAWLEHEHAGAVLVQWGATRGVRITLRRQESAIAWVEEIGVDHLFRGDLRPPVPDASCAPVPSPPTLSAPVPTGLLRLDARPGVDGCTELSFERLVELFDEERGDWVLGASEPPETRFACGYPYELFEPFVGGAIEIVQEWDSAGSSVLRLIEHREPDASGVVAVSKRLTISASHSFDFEAVPLTDCAQVNGCGEVVWPWRVAAVGGDWAAVGDQVWTRETLGRHERFASLGVVQGLAVDATCVDGVRGLGVHGVYALIEVFSETAEPMDPEPMDPEPMDPEPMDPEPMDPGDAADDEMVEP